MTFVITTNYIIAKPNRKMFFFQPNLNHYYAFVANQKFPFYARTGEQSLLAFLMF